MSRRVFAVVATLVFSFQLHASDRGFVIDSHVDNEAVIVSSLHGLPGGTHNIDNMKTIVTDPAYAFNAAILSESKAVSTNVFTELTAAASRVPANGTLLFYFSGHGGNQILQAQDRNIKTQELRAAIEAGRKDLGPVSRLVMIFDACHSGSNIGPISVNLDAVVEDFQRANRAEPYFDHLIALASSTAGELSWVNSEGHMFTTAMTKAFKESLPLNNTVGEFFALTKKYLTASTAQAKVIPDSLLGEKMAP